MQLKCAWITSTPLYYCLEIFFSSFLTCSIAEPEAVANYISASQLSAKRNRVIKLFAKYSAFYVGVCYVFFFLHYYLLHFTLFFLSHLSFCSVGVRFVLLWYRFGKAVVFVLQTIHTCCLCVLLSEVYAENLQGKMWLIELRIYFFAFAAFMGIKFFLYKYSIHNLQLHRKCSIDMFI